ncbi:hypothetical protein BC835DRAFT_1083227 [Cytidiella melzeri]|nr:hypothetical protein BC835DRAFT_1083227 [Cytidiella melzeri]
MNPTRPSPPGPPAAYSTQTPVQEDHRLRSMLSPHQLPTLPSIHHLHPELSTSPMTHPMASTSAHVGTSYHVSESARGYATRHGTDNSDPEEDPPGPPKKKRRRQALSCTECKRRKIKCDRAQPCGPCSRRGEQNKCQWHIIEPMEKYVARTEYDEMRNRVDELRNRVDYLEEVLTRMPGSYFDPRNPPSPALSAHTYRSQPTARAPYPVHPSPAHAGYRDMPSPYSPLRGEPPPLSTPALHSAPPQSPPYPPSTAYTEPTGRSTTSIPSSHGQSTRSLSTSPILTSSSRLRETDRPPGSRRASLSLAAITTPYTPDGAPHTHQSKNRQAQMPLPLGQRLRQTSVHTGPAAETPRRRARSGNHTTVNVTRRKLVTRRWTGSLLGRRLRPLAAAPHRSRVAHRRRPRHRHSREPPSVIGCLDRCLGTPSASSSYPSATIVSPIFHFSRSPCISMSKHVLALAAAGSPWGIL